YQYLEEQGVEDNEIQEIKAIQKVNKDADALRKLLLQQSDENLKEYLVNLNLEALGIKNASELIEHLRKAAETNDFSNTDIDSGLTNINKPKVENTLDQLVSSLRSELEDEKIQAEKFHEYILQNSPKSVRKFLRKIDLQKEGIETIEQLVSYIQKHNDEFDQSDEELQQLLFELLTGYTDLQQTSLETDVQEKEYSVAFRILVSILVSGIFFSIIFLLYRRQER
ncbi:hypothetical protein ACFLRQ_00005, partial [Bacteroidota bacterium]